MNDLNPYAPPKAPGEPLRLVTPGPAPAYKLYSPGQILLAAFLGTPGAGMYLLAANRRRLGHTGLAVTTFLVGVFITVPTIFSGFAVASGSGRTVPLFFTFWVGHYALSDEGLLDVHLARGGQKESSWKAAGVGLACLMAILGLITVVLVATGLD
jgi:hypothetical protein